MRIYSYRSGLNFLDVWDFSRGINGYHNKKNAAVAHPMTTFEQQVADQRGYLLKFARLQLRNETWAEDAVSEVILAALAKPHAFDYRSQLKTWLVGILKHKVIDALRQHGREVCQVDPTEDSNEDPLDYIGFKADGHFVEPPADWGNPEQQACSRQFFEVLEVCTNQLPPVQARLFLMREWLELSSEEICKELGLTSTNLYVQLHRARLRLRECLELNWYGKMIKT
jgi:RNA polymerase sigma-70 factor (ECF subfamily)